MVTPHQANRPGPYPSPPYYQVKAGAQPWDLSANERLRNKLINELEELPTGVIRQAMEGVDYGPTGRR